MNKMAAIKTHKGSQSFVEDIQRTTSPSYLIPLKRNYQLENSSKNSHAIFLQFSLLTILLDI